MNDQLYLRLVDRLLRRHYGITVDDVHVSPPGKVTTIINEGDDRPFIEVSRISEKHDLERDGDFVPAFAKVMTAGDEGRAICDEHFVKCNDLSSASCPLCGHHTEHRAFGMDVLDEDGFRLSHMICQRGSCGHEFGAIQWNGPYQEYRSGVLVSNVAMRNILREFDSDPSPAWF